MRKSHTSKTPHSAQERTLQNANERRRIATREMRTCWVFARTDRHLEAKESVHSQWSALNLAGKLERRGVWEGEGEGCAQREKFELSYSAWLLDARRAA